LGIASEWERLDIKRLPNRTVNLQSINKSSLPSRARMVKALGLLDFHANAWCEPNKIALGTRDPPVFVFTLFIPFASYR
jgi:hypothetical protein